MYRRTNPPLPPPKPKKPKPPTKSPRALRASKRRKLSGAAAFFGSDEDEDEKDDIDEAAKNYTGEFEWECVAVSLPDYQQFVHSIQKTKDPDEKDLRDTLLESVIPFMETIEEEQQRKRMKREKELLNMQLLAGAKRSSRIAGRAEKERHEQEVLEASRKHEAGQIATRKQQEKRKKMEAERHSRVAAREQRMKDRDQTRALHEAELHRIQEEQKKSEKGESRISERHLRAEVEKRKKMLRELNNDDHWIFDCSGCGIHGEDWDDGSHSVACERCGVWQHSECLGISEKDAEREDFHFICADCKRQEEEAMRPKLPPLKFRVGATPPSSAADGKGPEGYGEHEQQHLPQEMPPSPMKREKNGAPPESNSHTDVPQPTASSFEPPSPAKAANGHLELAKQQNRGLSPHKQQTVPPPLPLQKSTFSTQRPSSPHSVKSPTLTSPIQNRPSMSPTQGNRDVGPLAGFSSTGTANESTPWTPLGGQQQQQQQHVPPPTGTRRPSSSSIPNGYSPFPTATTTSGGGSTFGHSPPPFQGPHGIPSSGISPTKQPQRPMSGGGPVGASVMPPVEKLEPSPKLMGRSFPDAPIPPPVKGPPPLSEQEERKQNSPPAVSFDGHHVGPSA